MLLFVNTPNRLILIMEGKKTMIDHIAQPIELPESDTRPSSEQVIEHASNVITEDPPEVSITQADV